LRKLSRSSILHAALRTALLARVQSAAPGGTGPAATGAELQTSFLDGEDAGAWERFRRGHTSPPPPTRLRRPCCIRAHRTPLPSPPPWAGTVVFTLNRPATKNALGRGMMDLFRAALADVRYRREVRSVVLCSAVPRVFCAGADLKERAQMTKPEVAAFVDGLRAAFNAVAALPMPTIAAIEGVALGGGLELALACDFRIAGAGAELGLPETALAIIPGAGGTQRLPRLVGLSRAKELVFTARRVSAADAAAMGLVTAAVPAGQAMARALALAREIAPQGPVAVRMAKEAMDRGMEVDVATGMALEAACYAQVIPTADRLEGLAAFREKRKPAYRGE
jgi:methylglutaconyl-CoA hydratase